MTYEKHRAAANSIYSTMDSLKAAPPPTSISTIKNTLDRLDKEISVLMENANNLIDPLLSVLSSGDPRNHPICEDTASRAPGSCQMDERLLSFISRLVEANDRLVGLNAQIQL